MEAKKKDKKVVSYINPGRRLKGQAAGVKIRIPKDQEKETENVSEEENQLMRVLKKKDVVKLVEAGMNCSISDGEWVSVVHIVPKKGGIRFYRRFIMNLLKTTKPLRKLLNKVDHGRYAISLDAPL